jgi:hypothetical protein
MEVGPVASKVESTTTYLSPATSGLTKASVRPSIRTRLSVAIRRSQPGLMPCPSKARAIVARSRAGSRAARAADSTARRPSSKPSSGVMYSVSAL